MTAIGVAVWSSRSQPAPVDTATSQFQISAPDDTNVIGVPAISPDGRTIAFVASGADGRSRLWLRAFAELTARPMTGTDDAAAPFWSPDSRFVGFFARGQLKKVDVTGGAPQVVARLVSSSSVQTGTWSRGGVIVFSSGDQLSRVAAAGGDAESLSKLPGRARHPIFLPDGRHVLFSALSSHSTRGVYLAGLEPGTATLMADDVSSSAIYAPPGYLLFSRGSTSMAQPFDTISLRMSGEAVPLGLEDASNARGRNTLSVSDDGTLMKGGTASNQTELVWADRRGARVATVAEPGEYGNMALSPDGTRIAFDRVTGGEPDVWLLDLPRGVTSRFTFNPRTDNVPVWSPDGRLIAFATAVGSGLNIGQRVSNASRPAELLLQLNAPPIMYPSDWSADGRFLAYYRSGPKTGLDLWILPLGGEPAEGRKPRALLQSEFNESQGQFSPDGRWIAYVSDESGEPQVYVQSFPTLEGKWQVSRDGGTQPRWRSDGKELFYLASDQKLMATTVTSGEALELEAPHALFAAALTYTSRRQQYSVSKDGQRFLLNTPPTRAVSSPMTIVLNWTGLLKR